MTTFAQIALEAQKRVVCPPRFATPDDIIALFLLVAGLSGIVERHEGRIEDLERRDGAKRKRSR
jgi:hypothetical protein